VEAGQHLQGDDREREQGDGDQDPPSPPSHDRLGHRCAPPSRPVPPAGPAQPIIGPSIALVPPRGRAVQPPRSASRASRNVFTGTSRTPGPTDLAAARLSTGTRKRSAPARFAATILFSTPPMGPTLPSGEIVPVPAMVRPPVRSPGVSRSYSPSAHISPADGPPMSPLEIEIGNGKF